MINKVPKIIIIGNDFDQKSGAGITLTNLFKDWPSNKIAVVSESIKEIDLSICENYYKLGFSEDKRPWPFYLFQPKYKSGPIKIDPKYNSNANPDDLKLYQSKYNYNLKMFLTSFLHFIGIYYYIFRLRVSEKFLRWFDDFEPDIIYTQLSSLELIRFIEKLRKKRNKPIIIHFMDDWPSTLNQPGIFSFYWGRQIDNGLRNLLRKASANMSICQYMSNAYKERYNIDCIPFHNFIDPSKWENISKISWSQNGSFKILYAGRIGIGVSTSIFSVAQAIESVYNIGYNIEFQLLLLEVPKKFENKIKKFKSVKIIPRIDHDKMPEKLVDVDLLLIPLDFDDKSLKYTRLSMPTKVSEYMASGTPTLVFAHEKTALFNYAKESGWAYILGSDRQSDIKEMILKIMNDDLQKKHVGQNARKIAFQQHNATTVRKKFQEILKSVSIKNQ